MARTSPQTPKSPPSGKGRASGSRAAGSVGDEVKYAPDRKIPKKRNGGPSKLPPNSKRCVAKTKSGTRCQKLRHVDKETGELFEVCISHAPREAQQRAGFGGSQPGSGRPRTPTAREVIIAKLEARADELTAKLMDIALEGKRTVVVPGGRDDPGYTEEVPDEALQLKGTQYALDQLIGKAMSRNEIGGPEGHAIPVDITPSEDEQAAILKAIKEAEEAQ